MTTSPGVRERFADLHGRACSRLSVDHGEPLHAHAPPAGRAWLLLEDPGPWGSQPAARNRRVPGPVRAAAAALGIRLLLIRRHRGGEVPDARTCFLSWTGPGDPWLRQAALAELDQVRQADLDALAAGHASGFGEPVVGPLVLACTHGKVDACCARYGRVTAAALAGAFGERVWECSHVGGCRFAANLLCLPHGLLFGRAAPEAAVALAAGYAAGRIDLEHYRGRCGTHQAVQAADWFVRRQEGLVGINDLTGHGYRPLPGGARRVELTSATHRYLVDVRLEPHGALRPHGCGSDETWTPQAYGLLSLTRTALGRSD
ncbi:MAG TPA: sucrase ferredoxin [Egibacteraceae bacterium]|nr:sucrase ferredoxin [Egibacteraceae bacterium]